MDNVGKLSQAVEDIYKAAYEAQHPSNVGAMRGIMESTSSVNISGRTYSAVIATNVRAIPGVPVWCQLDGNGNAIVIGG